MGDLPRPPCRCRSGPAGTASAAGLPSPLFVAVQRPSASVVGDRAFLWAGRRRPAADRSYGLGFGCEGVVREGTSPGPTRHPSPGVTG